MMDRLRTLRDDWSDEIPEDIIPGRKRGQFKVRTNWWASLNADLEVGLIDGVFTPELIPAITAFIEKHSTPEFAHRSRTTAEQITEANALLNLILQSHE